MGLLNKILSKKNPTRDQFAALVMKVLAQNGTSNVVYDSAHFQLNVDGPKNTIFLDNGYANYCKAEKPEREASRRRDLQPWWQNNRSPKG